MGSRGEHVNHYTTDVFEACWWNRDRTFNKSVMDTCLLSSAHLLTSMCHQWNRDCLLWRVLNLVSVFYEPLFVILSFSFLSLYCQFFDLQLGTRVGQWVRSLNLTTHTSLSPLRRGFAPGFVNYKKGALDSQPSYSWNIVESGVKSNQNQSNKN